jgi:hypothetical protein
MENIKTENLKEKYENYDFNIGKYKGLKFKLKDILKNDISYCNWFNENYVYKTNKTYLALNYLLNNL